MDRSLVVYRGKVVDMDGREIINSVTDCLMEFFVILPSQCTKDNIEIYQDNDVKEGSTRILIHAYCKIFGDEVEHFAGSFTILTIPNSVHVKFINGILIFQITCGEYGSKCIRIPIEDGDVCPVL